MYTISQSRAINRRRASGKLPILQRIGNSMFVVQQKNESAHAHTILSYLDFSLPQPYTMDATWDGKLKQEAGATQYLTK